MIPKTNTARLTHPSGPTPAKSSGLRLSHMDEPGDSGEDPEGRQAQRRETRAEQREPSQPLLHVAPARLFRDGSQPPDQRQAGDGQNPGQVRADDQS